MNICKSILLLLFGFALSGCVNAVETPFAREIIDSNRAVTRLIDNGHRPTKNELNHAFNVVSRNYIGGYSTSTFGETYYQALILGMSDNEMIKSISNRSLSDLKKIAMIKDKEYLKQKNDIETIAVITAISFLALFSTIVYQTLNFR